MRTLTLGIALTAALGLTTAAAHAQTWRPPAETQRCPSKWGASDERGSANHMKPDTVLKAARLIKTGEVIEIGHVLNDRMPISATRRFDVHTKRTFMNPLSNRRGSNEELVISEIGQVGTQFDGFAHQSIEDSHYNCFKTDEIATRTGFTKLGIEKVGTLMTRGVLIDVAGLKGVDMLPDTYEISRRTCSRRCSGRTSAPAGRRRDHPHRLGQAVGEGQRALHEDAARASAWPRPSGWRSRTRCWSAPTTGRSRSPRTPTRSSRCPSTRSCSS